VTLSG
jgi:hypothetical protein